MYQIHPQHKLTLLLKDFAAKDHSSTYQDRPRKKVLIFCFKDLEDPTLSRSHAAILKLCLPTAREMDLPIPFAAPVISTSSGEVIFLSVML